VAKGQKFDETVRKTLRQYLTREITRAEAEARLGVRLPEMGEPKPLGEPDAQADWETLLQACVSDEERQIVQRARATAGTAGSLHRDEAQILLSVLSRVKATGDASASAPPPDITNPS
jgi:hypothetical protein